LLNHGVIFGAEDTNDFVLGAGDVVHIMVFQSPELTLDIKLPESGNINYPLIGSTNIIGLTVAAAETKIAKALEVGGYFKKPQVNIVILTPGNNISVLGQVLKPGRYALDKPQMRVADVLATAGGIIPTGSDTLIIKGMRDKKPYRKEIDIAALFIQKDSDINEYVVAGDEIYVHRAPMFYIYGEAQRPGSYRVERNMTVIQALAQGGGLTPKGTQRSIKLYRTTESGELQKLKPSMTDKIQTDDVLFIEESLF
jgi:polysaccharide export outer membrane protein